ncbi:hypothetical protein [Spirosoma aerophilum]
MKASPYDPNLRIPDLKETYHQTIKSAERATFTFGPQWLSLPV